MCVCDSQNKYPSLRCKYFCSHFSVRDTACTCICLTGREKVYYESGLACLCLNTSVHGLSQIVITFCVRTKDRRRKKEKQNEIKLHKTKQQIRNKTKQKTCLDLCTCIRSKILVCACNQSINPTTVSKHKPDNSSFPQTLPPPPLPTSTPRPPTPSAHLAVHSKSPQHPFMHLPAMQHEMAVSVFIPYDGQPVSNGSPTTQRSSPMCCSPSLTSSASARTTWLMPAFEVLGPLQISLGRMIGDITRFMVLFTLVSDSKGIFPAVV